jgi:hypothetical protein
MKPKRHVCMLVILAVVIPALWAVACAADKSGGSVPPRQSSVPQRDTLRGLNGVAVLVKMDNLGPYGLEDEQIQIDTELQLRQYGIRVLSAKECLTAPGTPMLGIHAAVLDIGIGATPLYLFKADIQFLQTVFLTRDPTLGCLAQTWSTSEVQILGRDRLPETRGIIKDQVAKFINDYLAVNLKDSKTKEPAAESKP